MIHGDEADVAAHYEQAERDGALARMRAVPQEAPDEDEQGNRYCLDCGEIIPLLRVQAVQAVRCVDCATVRERKERRISGGGIRTYLVNED
ncbi:TraR/DksA C4-type zinc finger protein [Acidithiobacillus sulfuriphilus]|uniref:TraR/DksA C4-type zinc finger protein n=1 Tax=Acidithiobacillus sulfuriphilus TaxID=1867749 RepID=UPI003F64368D